MNAKEAYLRIFNYLGKEPRAKILTEHEHVYSMRLRPGERLCVRKDTGEVLWEDDLPDELYPIGRGREIYPSMLNYSNRKLGKVSRRPWDNSSEHIKP